MNKNLFTQWLLPGLLLLMLGSGLGCSKENQIELIDNPPDVLPDTTIINYYGNLLLGTSPVPVDTIFTNTLIDSSGGPGLNVGYDLQAMTGPWLSFWMHWDANDPNEMRIMEGDYAGCCSISLNDSARADILTWLVSGQNPALFPNIDPQFAYDLYFSVNVNINISNLEENVRYEVVNNDTLWIDRAKVKMNGIMQDSSNHHKAISGEFICYFGRTN